MSNLPLRVALVGPESSGKTTLAQALATQYHTDWVAEYARTYLAKHGNSYTASDIVAIAEGQFAAEDAAAMRSQPLLFCDTEALVCKIWMEHRYGYCHERIAQAFLQRPYALFLLCRPDFAWEYDPLRELPDAEARETLFNQYEAALIAAKKPYIVVSGSLTTRIAQAKTALNPFLSLAQTSL